MNNTPTPRTEAVMVDPLSDWNDLAQLARKLETELSEVLRERDEAREAWKCIDEAIFTMKPRHIGHPTMDGRYPCWEVWLPQWGRVERKSLQNAVLEFVAQIKEETK